RQPDQAEHNCSDEDSDHQPRSARQFHDESLTCAQKKAARKRVGCPCGLAEEETRLVAMRRASPAGIACCYGCRNSCCTTDSPIVLFVLMLTPPTSRRTCQRRKSRRIIL